MNTKVESFFNSLKNKKITFIGIGITNRELLSLFAKNGADITVCDKRSFEMLGEIGGELQELGVKLVLGENYLENLGGDMIIRTPGLNFNNEKLKEAREKGIAVTSEMEIFFDLCPCKIFAITGSDGKTTTTTLVGKLLELEGKTVHLGGNIGKPLLYRINDIKPEDYAVVELSSFQLMSMRSSPDVSLITNISPNHLDIHASMQEYIDAKHVILAHQNAFSRAVLNEDNALSIESKDLVRGELLTFSRKHKVKNGAYLENNNIVLNYKGNIQTVLNIDEIKIPGLHNVENYMAAICMTAGLISMENIAKLARDFGGVEHRFEFVREIEGVKYFNDSIASSPTRTTAGLDSCKQKIILIAGGYDKKIPFDAFGEKILEKVKYLILMGNTAEKIKTAVTNCKDFASSGLVIVDVENMEEAIQKARIFAQNGDIVALSPACASFDKYKNFEERGNHFKKIVNAL
ncbi:MAG: UDP-N-acetylmuramoyl-L-alanine--D-glutamate ligase [Oscillospiraceae bacterium]